MYLSRIYIRHFRSIKELDLSLTPGKNVIVGRNNTGKSNIIKALDLILGEATPTYAKSENVTDVDFYSWKENAEGKAIVESAKDIFIFCELQRDPGEPLDYEEIYKCYGYYVHSEIVEWIGKKPIKKAIRIPKGFLPDDYADVFMHTEDNSGDKEYINPKLRHQKTFEQQFDDKFSFAFAFYATKDEQGNIIKDIRFLYREGKDSDWILGFKAPIRNELLQSAIIPSFRDPQNQLRLSSWTWYGKLMQYLTVGHADSKELKDAFSKVKEIADKIFENVKGTVARSTLDVAFPGTELHFQFNADSKLDLFKNCLIYVDDGFKSLLTEKGSGIQSATIIGLFTYFTQNVNTVTSALLCLEEPELYLHPHGRRVISDRLDEFLNGNKNQVILTTHSVEFVRTSLQDMNVVLVTKDSEGTHATRVSISEFKRLLIDNNQNELFFADKVIVCEGHDDFVLRAVAKELFPKHLDEENVSIISVGGKDNISTLVNLVIKLGIKAFVFADLDYFLRDKGDERKKYDAKAHESVVSLGQSFFSQACIFGVKGEVVLKKILQTRANIKKDQESDFYLAKQVNKIKVIQMDEVLTALRKNGLCILTGELEDLSKKAEFLSSNQKLTLDKVYDLNMILHSGGKITDIIETRQIAEFLDTVFNR